MHKWTVTHRQRCDLEMLMVGGFDPLKGFLSRDDYESVIMQSRLKNGALWPIPITLDVSSTFAGQVSLNDQIELYDLDHTLLAKMTVTDKWQPDKKREAVLVYATEDTAHPAVQYLFNQTGDWYLGGPIEIINYPRHYDFPELRFTPADLKTIFKKNNIKKIVGFQTRNPIHRAHLELTLKAADEVGGHILLHPVVGLTKPGDVDYYTRVRCYQKLLPYYPKSEVHLSLLPLAMRMAGPREALWHALIRKNYGCTHFIVGRDHAGPGKNSKGQSFYEPYAAQELVSRCQDEIGIHIIPFQEMVYIKERHQYCQSHEVKPGETVLSISGTELRSRLLKEEPIPDWFSFAEIITELRASYPPKHKQGFTVFLTGLSGSGKSTLANALRIRLMSLGKRNVTLLDGDLIRNILSTGLGFSKEDRNLNVKRIGYVASEVTKVGGIAICAAIAPFASARNDNRQMISENGGYIEVFLSTPIAECERRDPKGLYVKARKGEIKGFTGISDPYEEPINPELVIDTAKHSVNESIDQIISFLEQAGYLQIQPCSDDNKTTKRYTALHFEENT